METLIGIAAVICSVAALIFALLFGWTLLTWARRCDPKNRSFRPPSLPGIRLWK
jgi:hypothetical protein